MAGYYICVGVADFVVLGRVPDPSFGGSGSSSSISAPIESTLKSGWTKVCFNTNTTNDRDQPLAKRHASGIPTIESHQPSFTVPNTNVSFTVSLNTAHDGHDIAEFPVLSMADCLALCAQLHLYPLQDEGKCHAAAMIYGNSQTAGKCHLKGREGRLVKSTGADSAVIAPEAARRQGIARSDSETNAV